MKNYSGKIIGVLLLALALGVVGGCGSNNPANTNGNPNIFYASSMTFRNNSTVAWGYNGFGQFGNGTTTSHTEPRSSAFVGVKGVALGGFHALVFNNNTTLTAGGNSFGQLGRPLGTNVTQDVGFKPVVFDSFSTALHPKPRNIVAAAAGGMHNLLTDGTGRVWAWGAGVSGQLGNGSAVNSTVPVVVFDQINGVTLSLGTTDSPTKRGVAAGGSHSLALDSDGRVYAWGYNKYGQLGMTSIDLLFATPVGGLPAIKQIAAAGSFSLALDGSGNVWAWGENGRGQLGVEWDLAKSGGLALRPTPQIVGDISGVTAIAAGLSHVVALKSDGTVWTWGFNGYGQLGDNSKIDRFKPQQVTSTALTGVTAIRAFGNQSFARAGDGKWYAWGDNSQGQLGYSTAALTYSMVPTVVPGL